MRRKDGKLVLIDFGIVKQINTTIAMKSGSTSRTISKTLKGFNGVFEIRNNYETDTYRTIYAIKIDDAVYILHAFKKKSPKGIKTPQQTIDLIHQRLQTAIQISKNRES
ncbi:type II toxin-antitoxin system RelE/ParE family toxin [Dolichospermum sp. FACHB-1091]|nr:type II toxin-antitoxin system RelE/ParE family toxin [Dolichospermum sp. FACHB-1091]